MAGNKYRNSDNDSKAKLETDIESDVDKQINLVVDNDSETSFETAIESVDDFEVKDLYLVLLLENKLAKNSFKDDFGILFDFLILFLYSLHSL